MGKAALSSLTAGLQRNRALTPWLWVAMYARQMEMWLKYFRPAQFYIIPMHQISSDSKDVICTDLKKRLDFNVDCNSKGAQALHSWSHGHPPVSSDAGDLRDVFDQ